MPDEIALLPNARGNSPLNRGWAVPEDPDALLAGMTRPRRLKWFVVLAPPSGAGSPAFYEVLPVVGVARDPMRIVTCRECRPLVTLSAPLAPGLAIRVFDTRDPDGETVARQMLRDWQHGALFSDPIDFDFLIT